MAFGNCGRRKGGGCITWRNCTARCHRWCHSVDRGWRGWWQASTINEGGAESGNRLVSLGWHWAAAVGPAVHLRAQACWVGQARAGPMHDDSTRRGAALCPPISCAKSGGRGKASHQEEKRSGCEASRQMRTSAWQQVSLFSAAYRDLEAAQRPAGTVLV